MSNDRFVQPAAAEADPAPAWPPEELEVAWERVLDCGALGPAEQVGHRQHPALFYQAGRPAGSRIGAENARPS